MSFKSILSIACLVGLSLGSIACSTQATSTHRWQTDQHFSDGEYRLHNHLCAPDGGPRGRYLSDSKDFVAYRQCMENKGYVLAAMR